MNFSKLLLLGAIALTACREPVSVTNKETFSKQALPSLSQQFTCLPTDAAFMAAHRGTSRGSAYPENSKTALKALIAKGYLFAEIDVAKIKDGTHILFHDGKWDDKSTGTGIVAATPRSVFETIALRDTNGLVQADTPPMLSDFLEIAKDNIYLEIDFKSSADYETVIKMVREADMTEQVILISYSPGQARKLAALAPDMLISVSAKTDADIKSLQVGGVELEQMAIWRGKSAINSKLLASLREKGVPVLRSAPKNDLKKAAQHANVLVSDYIFDYEPIIGLTSSSRKAYETCLSN